MSETASSTPTIPTQRPRGRAVALWQRLTDSPRSLPRGQAYPARMLASLQVVLVALSVVAVLLTLIGIFEFPGIQRDLTLRLTAAVSLSLAAAYGVGRLGRYHLSAFLTVGITLAASVAAAITNPAATLAPAFVVLGGLIGSLFLPSAATAAVFALTFVLAAAVALSIPGFKGPGMATVLYFVAAVGVTTLMASLQRENRGAQLRQQEAVLADRTRRLEEALRAGETANQELTRSLNDLHRLQTETGLLSEWSEMMHACASPEDVYPVIHHYLPRIFPRTAGALYVLSPSRNDLELRAEWGEAAVDRPGVVLPDDCWALRRGQVHLVGGPDQAGPRCAHLGADGREAAVCAPLMAHSETLGLLTLDLPGPGAGTATMGEAAQLVAEASRRAAIALANVQLRETLRNQSVRDPMTNLFNRRVMEEMLVREIRRSERSRRPFSLLMLDLDHFKAFNDDYGHPAGDLLLQQLAQLLTGRIRGSDIACRYGGEELVVILVEAGLEDAVRRADDLRREVGELRIEYRGAPLRAVTCSIGVACYPTHGASTEALIRAADSALYQAKAAGRDRVVSAATPA